MTSLRFENLQEFPASVKASHQVFGTATFSPRYFQILFSFNLETSFFRFAFILRNRLNRSRKLHERAFPPTNMRVCWSGLAASWWLDSHFHPEIKNSDVKKAESHWTLDFFHPSPYGCSTPTPSSAPLWQYELLFLLHGRSSLHSVQVWQFEKLKMYEMMEMMKRSIKSPQKMMPPYRSRCKRSTANMKKTQHIAQSLPGETTRKTRRNTKCSVPMWGMGDVVSFPLILPSKWRGCQCWICDVCSCFFEVLYCLYLSSMFWLLYLSLFFSCRFCCSKFENIAFPSSTPRCSRCCSAAASSSLASVILWTWLNSLRIWSLRIWKFKWKKWKSFKSELLVTRWGGKGWLWWFPIISIEFLSN